MHLSRLHTVGAQLNMLACSFNCTRSILCFAAPINRARKGSSVSRPRKDSVKRATYQDLYGSVEDTGNARAEERFKSPEGKQKKGSIVRFETASGKEWDDANAGIGTTSAPRSAGTTTTTPTITEVGAPEYDELTVPNKAPWGQHNLAPRNMRNRPLPPPPDLSVDSWKKSAGRPRHDFVDDSMDADAPPLPKKKGKIKKMVSDAWGTAVEKRKIKKAKTQDFGSALSNLEKILKQTEDTTEGIKGRAKRKRALADDLRRVCEQAVQEAGRASEAAQVLEDAITADDELHGPQRIPDNRIAAFKRAITESKIQEELKKDPTRHRREILEQDKGKGKKRRKSKPAVLGLVNDRRILNMHSRTHYLGDLLLADDYGEPAVLSSADTPHTPATPGKESGASRGYGEVTPFAEAPVRTAGPTHGKMLQKMPSAYQSNSESGSGDEEEFLGFDLNQPTEAHEETFFGGFNE